MCISICDYSFTGNISLMTVKRTNALGFIFITILIDVIGVSIVIPIIPTLIRQLTGASLSKASTLGGWLSISYAIMQFFCSPVLGRLSDHFGRRPILLISLLGLGVDYFSRRWHLRLPGCL